jgi:hypothetical protein
MAWMLIIYLVSLNILSDKGASANTCPLRFFSTSHRQRYSTNRICASHRCKGQNSLAKTSDSGSVLQLGALYYCHCHYRRHCCLCQCRQSSGCLWQYWIHHRCFCLRFVSNLDWMHQYSHTISDVVEASSCRKKEGNWTAK